MTINWKQAAKWYREQFLLWARAYNEIADIYMIEESLSAGNPYSATVHLIRRVPDSPLAAGSGQVSEDR